MVSFPYLKEKVKDGYVFRPKIPIAISYKGNRIDTFGAIDVVNITFEETRKG